MISNVDHLKLNFVDLSAQGLLKAFEVIFLKIWIMKNGYLFQLFCDKPMDSKCVEMHLSRSSVVDELFAFRDLKFIIEEGRKDERILIDR